MSSRAGIWLSFTVVLIAGLISYFFILPQSSKQAPAITFDVAPASPNKPALLAISAPVQGDLLVKQLANLPPEHFDETGFEDNLSAWQVNNNKVLSNSNTNTTQAKSLTNVLATTPHQTISFNDSMQQDISIGDTISLPLPDGSSVDVTVTQERLELNGDYTWEGSIKQNNQHYPVVITQGVNGTFGSIATNENTFTITTIDDVGVIYQNPPLPDTHGDDYLIVPQIK